jgi:hypothetical protein
VSGYDENSGDRREDTCTGENCSNQIVWYQRPVIIALRKQKLYQRGKTRFRLCYVCRAAWFEGRRKTQQPERVKEKQYDRPDQ